MTEILTYHLQLHTQVSKKKKKTNRKYRESHISKKTKTVEKCEVPEMKVGGEDEETGRPIKR